MTIEEMTVEEWKQKNPPIRRKPITNADRIRAMTDVELADELLEWFACFNAVEWTKETILDHLRQEVEEGE